MSEQRHSDHRAAGRDSGRARDRSAGDRRRPSTDRPGARREFNRDGTPRRPMDRPRRTAFEILREVDRRGAYANLATRQAINDQELTGRDAAFVTELAYGTCRMLGTYDAILAQASGRDLNDLQPDIVDALRLGAHQLLGMRIPDRAAVDTTVDLAAIVVGERVAGLANAIMRKVAAHDLEAWCRQLAYDEQDFRCLVSGHPDWIVDAYQDLLPTEEVDAALAADNIAPVPTLVVRPGLYKRKDLLRDGGDPTRWSPWGVIRPGNPGDLGAVRDGRAGVQDEGSQLICLAATRADIPRDLPWLDMCAGPGGKSALLRGMAPEHGAFLTASEVQPHRAHLVAQSLRRYPAEGHETICADGTAPAWQRDSFGLVMADVPCSGLGALRRRPDARWRKDVDDLVELGDLQRSLLSSALDACRPGGVVAYVTCSPHRMESADIVLADTSRFEILDAPALIPEVPGAAASADARFIQLWPHRHGTDAMFMALLRKR
ncbi:Putative ribosomal RNA small subunit methyltransferase B [Propionibacterium freudenreichii]|nr:Putative ribosomal RNA small subunit methyltransferase B [Propionibacterium freudenreichii]SCQ68695.1 Putative ribosomal RNA small subunit methyltransferase B [Propionibacterium freudenreichii]